MLELIIGSKEGRLQGWKKVWESRVKDQEADRLRRNRDGEVKDLEWACTSMVAIFNMHWRHGDFVKMQILSLEVWVRV